MTGTTRKAVVRKQVKKVPHRVVIALHNLEGAPDGYTEDEKLALDYGSLEQAKKVFDLLVVMAIKLATGEQQ